MTLEVKMVVTGLLADLNCNLQIIDLLYFTAHCDYRISILLNGNNCNCKLNQDNPDISNDNIWIS